MKQPLVVSYFPLLEAISRIKSPKSQKLLLHQLAKNRQFVRCLKEVAKNTAGGNINLTASDKRRLNKHTRIVRLLTKKRGVNQSGGFIGAIVPLLASVVGSLLLNK